VLHYWISSSVFVNLRTRYIYIYIIQHNPARIYNCYETGSIIVQHKHTKIFVLKNKRQISSLQSAERRSLVTVVSCISPTGQFIPSLLVFQIYIYIYIYICVCVCVCVQQELMNSTPPGQPTRAITRGGYRTRFSPSGFFISSDIQTDKRISCFLSAGRALFTHKEHGGH